MKLPEHSQDPFAPLRELRSPAATKAIRERVLERVASVSLWGQLRSVAAEALIVGIAATAILRISASVPHSLTTSEPAVLKPNAVSVPTAIQLAKLEIVSHKASGVSLLSAGISSTDLANETLRISSVTSTPPASIEPAVYVPAKISMLALQPMNIPADIHLSFMTSWFASVSGGAMFSELRILAERGEIGFKDGWKTVALAYMNANGAADIRGELLHHPGLTAPFLSKEGEQQFSLLFGANTHVGNFEFRSMVGPSYLYSSSQNYAPASGIATAPAMSAGFGVSAEASVFYSLNSSFQGGITGITSYGSSILNLRQASGLFASFNYCFGQ